MQKIKTGKLLIKIANFHSIYIIHLEAKLKNNSY